MASSILASSMAFIDATALNVVLPSLQQEFSASASSLFWVLNAYLLILASLILIGGALGDNLGRRKIFIIGILIFVGGSMACGLAGSLDMLILFRVLQAMGGALMIPGSLALISSSIQKKERGRAIGIWSACTTLVMLGGPVLGGALADSGLWRYIFFINVPLGLVAGSILIFRVAETIRAEKLKKIDFSGAILAALSLACITYGLLSLPDHKLWTFFVAGSIGGGIICFLIFILVEWKTDNAMMPLTLFRDKVFAGTNLLTFFLYAGLGGAMLFLSLNLVQAQGYNQLQSGMAFLPFTLLMIALSGIAGKLSDKYGARLFLTFGPVVSALGFFLLSLPSETQGPQAYWISFFPGILALGIGMSFTVSPLTATVMGSVREEFSGVASGINNSLSRIASVFANAIFGALALIIFSNTVARDLKSKNYTLSEYRIIETRTSSFGAARAPKSFAAQKQTDINKSYRQSFIYSYQLVLKGAAVLAIISAGIALVFLRPKN